MLEREPDRFDFKEFLALLPQAAPQARHFVAQADQQRLDGRALRQSLLEPLELAGGLENSRHLLLDVGSRCIQRVLCSLDHLEGRSCQLPPLLETWLGAHLGCQGILREGPIEIIAGQRFVAAELCRSHDRLPVKEPQIGQPCVQDRRAPRLRAARIPLARQTRPGRGQIQRHRGSQGRVKRLGERFNYRAIGAKLRREHRRDTLLHEQGRGAGKAIRPIAQRPRGRTQPDHLQRFALG